MSELTTQAAVESQPDLGPLTERREDGVLVLSHGQRSAARRVLHVNNYGMAEAWRLWKRGDYPGQHLWGCLELARMGYDVVLPEPVRGHGWRKRLKVDLKPALSYAPRLGRDDVVYCSQNILFWTPLLRAVKRIRASVVGLLYAHESLPFGRFYQGAIGMTPAGFRSAQRLAPGAKHAHLGWGMDMGFYAQMPYEPEFVLSCGKTYRDFRVIADAFGEMDVPLKMICPYSADDVPMPDNVERISRGEVDSSVSYAELKDKYYRRALCVLVSLLPDPGNKRAVGFTNLLEAMAMGRPVVVTRTGAIVEELDVEKHGVGIFCEPGDAKGMRSAIEYLAQHPREAEEMGRRGRQLCENHYNTDRYAHGLHELFESL